MNDDPKTLIHISLGDHSLLKVYEKTENTTMRAALHHFIGTGARCHEENHIETIAFLEESVRSQARIILAYLEIYGQLRV